MQESLKLLPWPRTTTNNKLWRQQFTFWWPGFNCPCTVTDTEHGWFNTKKWKCAWNIPVPCVQRYCHLKQKKKIILYCVANVVVSMIWVKNPIVTIWMDVFTIPPAKNWAEPSSCIIHCQCLLEGTRGEEEADRERSKYDTAKKNKTCRLYCSQVTSWVSF